MAKSRSHSIANTNPTPQSVSKDNFNSAHSEQSSMSSSSKKRATVGEIVSKVEPKGRYQIFITEGGKEKPYKDSEGNLQFRTGTQVTDKMVYNPAREGWESKKQIEKYKRNEINKKRRYIIRRVK